MKPKTRIPRSIEIKVRREKKGRHGHGKSSVMRFNAKKKITSKQARTFLRLEKSEQWNISQSLQNDSDDSTDTPEDDFADRFSLPSCGSNSSIATFSHTSSRYHKPMVLCDKSKNKKQQSNEAKTFCTPLASSTMVTMSNLPLNEHQVSAAFPHRENDSIRMDSKLSDVEEERRKLSTVKYILAEKTHTLFMVMEHPSSFAMSGTALIRVLFGAVNVLGYEFNSSHTKFTPVYSSKRTIGLNLETVATERKGVPYWERLTENLNEFATQDVSNSIVQMCTGSTVIIAVKDNTLATAVNFSRTYIPSGLAFDYERDLHQFGLILSKVDEFTVKFLPDCDAVCDRLLSAVLRYKMKGGVKAPCFFVYGKKGSGKSTTIRYFINRMLNTFSSICYLDCDPGQTEFTPPGCVSVTEVTEPLLGPPFTHLKTPEKMAFYGSVNISDCLGLYTDCVRAVTEYYNEKLLHIPLVVNTYGWIEGIGKEGLDFIRGMVMPNYEIEIVNSEEGAHPGDTNETLTSSHYKPIEIKIPSSCPNLNYLDAPNRRNLAILTYLGRCQPRYEAMQPINNFRPYRMSIKNVVIHVIHHDIVCDLLIHSINAQFVALYHMKKEDIKVHVPENEDDVVVPLPKRLITFEQTGECIGFGFVRAIDIINGFVYIITPESKERLSKVNALIKGNITAPNEIFLKQKEMQCSLPYVMEAVEKLEPEMKNLKPFFHKQSAFKNRKKITN